MSNPLISRLRSLLSTGLRSLHTTNVHFEVASVSVAKTLDPSPSIDLKQMFSDIHLSLLSELKCHSELASLSQYYFDNQGKSIRPVIAMTLANALNAHLMPSNLEEVVHQQRQVSMVSEMIHTASLVHDDILDNAECRRGKRSINSNWDARKSVFTGDYVLAVASNSLAALGNEQVLIILAQVLEDLVKGELQQLEMRNDPDSRFELYLQKTFNKTASLIAHTCQASAIIAGGDGVWCERAFEFGRNLGIAFQLVDDVLDLEATSAQLGKPASGNDLKLGLATAPVLFAALEHPELEKLIRRRFADNDDVAMALHAVHDSQGIQKTRQLAQKHCNHALDNIEQLKLSTHKWALIQLVESVLSRKK